MFVAAKASSFQDVVSLAVETINIFLAYDSDQMIVVLSPDNGDDFLVSNETTYHKNLWIAESDMKQKIYKKFTNMVGNAGIDSAGLLRMKN